MAEKRLASPEEIYELRSNVARTDGNAVVAPGRIPEHQPAPSPVPRPVRRPVVLPETAPRPGVRPRRRISFLFIAIMVVASALLIQVVGGYSELNAIAAECESLKEEITALEKQTSALEYQLDMVMPLAYVEQYARNQLGMSLPSASDRVLVGQNNTESYYVASAQEEKGFLSEAWEALKDVALTVWNFVN
ncbi:MAG: septum formation initiator family protein [Clostridia bacterium]|nr:septum formation initiator family protein [Clostridia bacterium]